MCEYDILLRTLGLKILDFEYTMLSYSFPISLIFFLEFFTDCVSSDLNLDVGP